MLLFITLPLLNCSCLPGMVLVLPPDPLSTSRWLHLPVVSMALLKDGPLTNALFSPHFDCILRIMFFTTATIASSCTLEKIAPFPVTFDSLFEISKLTYFSKDTLFKKAKKIANCCVLC